MQSTGSRPHLMGCLSADFALEPNTRASIEKTVSSARWRRRGGMVIGELKVVRETSRDRETKAALQ